MRFDVDLEQIDYEFNIVVIAEYTEVSYDSDGNPVVDW